MTNVTQRRAPRTTIASDKMARIRSDLDYATCSVCRAHMSPDITRELMRDYEIARAAGLLGDYNPPILAVASILSIPYPMDSIEDGAAHATDALGNVILAHMRKKGLE
jgi:hypothetical protein